MADTTLNTIIQLRNDETSNWTDSEVILTKGEIGLEYQDDGSVKMKAGDGEHKFSELDYIGSDVKQAQVYQSDVLTSTDEQDDITVIETLIPEGTEVQNGDIAIVKRYITGESGAISYTSYVYDTDLGWAATDGNYSANNVFFKEDLLTTTAMGNITLSNGQATISAKGKNIVDVFNTIYVKETNTGLKTKDPAASLTSGITYQEIGTTSSKTVTVSLSEDGNYKYGYTTQTTGENGDSPEASTIVNSTSVTGVVVDSSKESPYTLTFDGETVEPSVAGGASFVLSPEAQNEKASMSSTGTVYHTAGKAPISNLKKMYPGQAIPAGSKSATQEHFRWYVPFFQGFTYSDSVIADPKNITAEQLTTGLSAPVTKTSDGKVTSTSTVVKNIDATAYDKTKCTAAVASKAWRQYFLAYPVDYSYDMSGAKDANGIDCTVNKANNVTVSINGVNVTYAVYYINNAADYGTLGITWTLG